jgi:SAM-dependent methyltransferase
MFPLHYFERIDESDDQAFYQQPRLVVHIDDAAIAATTKLYREYLPPGGAILDLMSSWRSHLPEQVMFRRVVGLGMNEIELRENPQLSEYVCQNLNVDPQLPFADGEFDAGVLTVSVQYLTRPLEVYAEIGRVLRPGAPFLTVFSNRMFPTKAVAIWRALDDAGHAKLVASYYQGAGCFGPPELLDRSPRRWGADPLFAVVACRK